MSEYAERELPKYQCHKIVHALKVNAVVPVPVENSPGAGQNAPNEWMVHFADDGYAPIDVTNEWACRHLRWLPDGNGKPLALPVQGGYYVVYDDGYVSWSPTKAFESGYTKL